MKLRKGQALSLFLHAGAVFALLHFSAVEQIRVNQPKARLIWAVTKIDYHLDQPPGNSRGGGSGRDVIPPSKGQPPRPTPKQLIMPTTKAPEHEPLLPVEPAIVGELSLVRVPILGDPLGRIGPPSDGTNHAGGIGRNGRGGGVGENSGPSIGDGEGGNIPGGRSQIGVVTQPSVLYMIEPEFTEEARKARLQGTVVLHIEIDERGQAHNIRVQSPLGLGLDEKAVEAVKKWRFKAATRNGKAFRTSALVEVNFRLL